MILKLYRFSTPLPWVYEGWEPISPTDVRISTRTRNDRGPHVQVDTKQPAPELDHKLRIVTWNVWFEATLQELRYRHLIRILGENVCCLTCLACFIVQTTIPDPLLFLLFRILMSCAYKKLHRPLRESFAITL